MLRSLVALAAGVAVLTASGCCWPYHGGRHGGRGYGAGGYDDGPAAERPEPPRGARGRPAPPAWRY